jgi:hypothetical protein
MRVEAIVSSRVDAADQSDAAVTWRIGMSNRKLPRLNTAITEHNPEVGQQLQTTLFFASGRHAEIPDAKQTDSVARTQAELPPLLDALWQAINLIEEKAPNAPIERELLILDNVAEAFEKMISEPGCH